MTFWEFTISFLGEEGHTVFMRPFLKLFNYLIILYCKWYLLQEKIFKKDIFLKSLHSVVASYVPFVIFEFGIFFHLYAISTNNRTLSLVSLPINLIIPEKNQPSKSTDKKHHIAKWSATMVKVLYTFNWWRELHCLVPSRPSFNVRAKEGGKETIACRLYPSHGPLRFITSHSRFVLASAMRKTKRLRRRLRAPYIFKGITWKNVLLLFKFTGRS